MGQTVLITFIWSIGLKIRKKQWKQIHRPSKRKNFGKNISFRILWLVRSSFDPIKTLLSISVRVVVLTN